MGLTRSGSAAMKGWGMMNEAQLALIIQRIMEQGRRQASGMVLIMDELHLRQIITDVVGEMR